MLSNCPQAHRINYDVLGKFILLLIVVEACLGGGGRLFDFGTLSIRMYLFALGLCYVAYGVIQYKKSINSVFLKVTLTFFVLISLSAMISLGNRLPLYSIFNELKPTIYFFSLLFFSIVIRDVEHIKLISSIFKMSALIISALFIATFLGWKLGFVNYNELHALLNPYDDPRKEFIFRNDITFYFKSLIYVAIATFFYMAENCKTKKYICIAILLLTIALTMTRGVWLAVFLTLALHAFTTTNNKLKNLLYSLLLTFVGFVFVFVVSTILPAAHISDSDKMVDLQLFASLVINHFSYFNILFGVGPGYPTPNPIEITYLDIFLKFGIFGVLFWLFPIIFIMSNAVRLSNSYRHVAMPFILSSVFIYIVSFTNAFLTNPIGMAIVLISMVTLHRLVDLSLENHEPATI